MGFLTDNVTILWDASTISSAFIGLSFPIPSFLGSQDPHFLTSSRHTLLGGTERASCVSDGLCMWHRHFSAASAEGHAVDFENMPTKRHGGTVSSSPRLLYNGDRETLMSFMVPDWNKRATQWIVSCVLITFPTNKTVKKCVHVLQMILCKEGVSLLSCSSWVHWSSSILNTQHSVRY